MHRGTERTEQDPRSTVAAPVLAALQGIIARALFGLLLVACAALLPLGLRLEPSIHETLHFLIPASWVAYAALAGILLLVRRAPTDAEVWERAALIDPDLTRLAKLSSNLMLTGWLGILATVLAHHHLSSARDAFIAAGIISPLTLAAWILAALAWTASCRASLARAEDEAAHRLREYWHGLGRNGRRS